MDKPYTKMENLLDRAKRIAEEIYFKKEGIILRILEIGDLVGNAGVKKIKTELNWEPHTKFEDGIIKTIDWYLANPKWLE